MIDEKKLIECLERQKFGLPHSATGQHEVYLENVIDYIKDFPKVDNWIPVKKRLPEDEGYYLTCDKKGNEHVFYHHKAFEYPFGIHKNHSQYYMPIAWMPLPEPYKEVEESRLYMKNLETGEEIVLGPIRAIKMSKR